MTSALRQQFDQGAAWFNERPIRERALLTITALVVVLFAGWELAAAPVVASNEQLRSRLVSLSDTRASLMEQQGLLTEQLASDPSQVLRNQLAARQQRLERLNNELAETTGRLIAPRAMVLLLRDMLAAQDKLELLGVDLLAPVPVFDRQSGSTLENASGNDESAEPLLFAHDAEIVLRGGYMDVLAYLETLEAMDARLGWVLLEYDSSDYPDNEVRIRVRTLSLDRAWLGV
ncbi:MSHA biogenesis protein MshJ [Marinobacter panjinensis]|uniref:MSHA biogenesis protein MshJ n=1 Tax=Marinobacter panjinensis TaxID=2576384 RepID=A0A4U6QS23_9GAMM|nr:type II secretion system protein M [Marinobacter panjinensis]MCR8916409.1 type II secretion system protein M [Marinobacter panjinensis]TKV63369.1 MSHA biogenesis protein MshJ [Marinobacter panjinensis]